MLRLCLVLASLSPGAVLDASSGQKRLFDTLPCSCFVNFCSETLQLVGGLSSRKFPTANKVQTPM